MIAGGGTGGHLFPGLAVAEEVITRHPGNEVVFVGTSRGLEARVVPAAGFPLEILEARGLKGTSLGQRLLGLWALPRALWASFRLLWRYRPDVVLGVGGYVSGPVVLAAWFLRVPTAVQEQNALPGLTNRILGRLASAVFVSFEEARAFFPRRRTHLVGNPVRRALLDNFLRSTVKHEKFTVLVFGGSLGARGLNTRVLEALGHLQSVKDTVHFVHQTGKHDLDRVQKAYAEAGMEAEVTEFIDDMSGAYAKADLVVCRAGATTLAELTICKKASLLVPFPHATDDHQAVNAQAMVSQGASRMFREEQLTGEQLAREIVSLLNDRERLRVMEKKAALLGRPEAARELADVCVKLMVRAYGPQGRKRANAKSLRKGAARS
jgi:UDP-N-acetylglucosamine--N-acetylmuramyl-(pentapeptide) pyrophosphoryl-undecaprenol N-acetylglucosamine transferase